MKKGNVEVERNTANPELGLYNVSYYGGGRFVMSKQDLKDLYDSIGEELGLECDKPKCYTIKEFFRIEAPGILEVIETINFSEYLEDNTGINGVTSTEVPGDTQNSSGINKTLEKKPSEEIKIPKKILVEMEITSGGEMVCKDKQDEKINEIIDYLDKVIPELRK